MGESMFRRRFLGCFAAFGLSSTLLPGTLWAILQEKKEAKIDVSMLRQAEKLAGLEFTDAERELMVDGVNEALEDYGKLHAVAIDNSVAPALRFDPVVPGMVFERERRPLRFTPQTDVTRPDNLEEIAFWPVTRLSALIRSRQVSSRELTTLYLDRLKRHDPTLHCVITLTEELAMEQAARADEELGRGVWRGPLHGIPWGAKDLLATRGYPTTWGAAPYRDQKLDYDATVVTRLTEAGAVLVAKLTLGALAWGDVWFGGMTRNPWDPEQGSSGSSAGPASAAAAGLVGFSIGTETLGSIVSPSTRCGVTGLRPTFGRVSRQGAMALSWSMDKIGPICRSVEDCALVLDAIYGPDGHDLTVADHPFNWDDSLDARKLRVGYLKSAFEREGGDEKRRQNERATLAKLREIGFNPVEVKLPDQFPTGALSLILSAEAAAAFDELTRSNRDDLLVRQVKRAWPNSFRQARLIPAVEYIQANRVRRMLMGAMANLMSDIDVYVAPSFGGDNLLLTNLTGHPSVTLPNGFDDKGSPTSIGFTGKLFGEAELLAVAKTYQDATDFHLQKPSRFV